MSTSCARMPAARERDLHGPRGRGRSRHGGDADRERRDPDGVPGAAVEAQRIGEHLAVAGRVDHELGGVVVDVDRRGEQALGAGGVHGPHEHRLRAVGEEARVQPVRPALGALHPVEAQAIVEGDPHLGDPVRVLARALQVDDVPEVVADAGPDERGDGVGPRDLEPRRRHRARDAPEVLGLHLHHVLVVGDLRDGQRDAEVVAAREALELAAVDAVPDRLHAVVVEDHARQHEVVAQQLPVRRHLDLGDRDVGLRVHGELRLHLGGVARRVGACAPPGRRRRSSRGSRRRRTAGPGRSRGRSSRPRSPPRARRRPRRPTRPTMVTSPFTSSVGRGARMEMTGPVRSLRNGTSVTVALPAASVARTATRCGPSSCATSGMSDRRTPAGALRAGRAGARRPRRRSRIRPRRCRRRRRPCPPGAARTSARHPTAGAASARTGRSGVGRERDRIARDEASVGRRDPDAGGGAHARARRAHRNTGPSTASGKELARRVELGLLDRAAGHVADERAVGELHGCRPAASRASASTMAGVGRLGAHEEERAELRDVAETVRRLDGDVDAPRGEGPGQDDVEQALGVRRRPSSGTGPGQPPPAGRTPPAGSRPRRRSCRRARPSLSAANTAPGAKAAAPAVCVRVSMRMTGAGPAFVNAVSTGSPVTPFTSTGVSTTLCVPGARSGSVRENPDGSGHGLRRRPVQRVLDPVHGVVVVHESVNDTRARRRARPSPARRR